MWKSGNRGACVGTGTGSGAGAGAGASCAAGWVLALVLPIVELVLVCSVVLGSDGLVVRRLRFCTKSKIERVRPFGTVFFY